ncbi:MAG: UvrD-helicase domain-containing protein, partial [Candidatus Omnitrophota bacterium]
MSLKINYQQALNSAQYKAATSVDGPYLVIAGAGSGKTRVLIYRTAYLIEQGVKPEQVLLLTFTRRAAQEMLKRAAVILDDRCENVTGGTFHSFANTLLRRYGEHVG